MWCLASWVRGTQAADPLHDPLLENKDASQLGTAQPSSSRKSSVAGQPSDTAANHPVNLPEIETSWSKYDGLPVSTGGSTREWYPPSRPESPQVISLSRSHTVNPSNNSSTRISPNHQSLKSPSQDPFGPYQRLLEPLLQLGSSPAAVPASPEPCSVGNDRCQAYRGAASVMQQSISQSSPAWRMTDAQLGMSSRRQSSLDRHDSAASCTAQGRVECNGMGQASNQGGPNALHCNCPKGMSSGSLENNTPSASEGNCCAALRHSNPDNASFCGVSRCQQGCCDEGQGRQLQRADSSGSSRGGNCMQCGSGHARTSRLSSFGEEPSTPPLQSTQRPSGSRRSTLSHSSLANKFWQASADADATSVSSHYAAQPGTPPVQWLPYMHPSGQVLAMPTLPAATTTAAMTLDQAAERARDALRLWRGATKWVALWLLLSVLTLLHSFALIEALYDVPIAKVCALLFCWTGLLGAVGSAHSLAAGCVARQRSNIEAAAGSLGLKVVALLAFMTMTLSALASAVHFLVLQLFTHDAHLPPCAPDQRVCAETYNLLLVLMVATVVMYGVHAAVSGVVACKAHHARQVLRSPAHRSSYI